MHLRYPASSKAVLSLSIATTFLFASHAKAQDWNRYYVDFKVGPAFVQNDSIQTSQFGNHGNIHFDTGVRADVGFGYHLCRDFAVELQTGVSRNTVDSMAGNLLSDFGSSADFYQIPVLVNGIYQFPLHGKFKPYIGAGVGGEAGFFHQTNVPGTTGRDFNDQDLVFAYQGVVGFKYILGEHLDLGLAYEFLGTADHQWSDLGVNLKTDGTMTHAVLATLSWQF